MILIGIFIAALYFLSITFLIFIWSIYIRYRLIIKHPNNLFFIVATIQIIEMITIIIIVFALGYYPGYTSISGQFPIQVVGYISKFTKIYALHYLVSINIEIFIKLQKSLVFNHRFRMFFYTVYNFLASCLLTIFGRGNKDSLLSYYMIGRVIYEVYSVFIVFLLTFMVVYFYLKFKDKLSTKDMTSLTIITIISVIIMFFQVSVGLIIDGDLEKNDYVNFASYFLNSLEGILEIIIFQYSKQMKTYMKESIYLLFSRNSKRFTEISLSLPIKINEDSLEYSISNKSLGFFGDAFENITTLVVSM